MPEIGLKTGDTFYMARNDQDGGKKRPLSRRQMGPGEMGMLVQQGQV